MHIGTGRAEGLVNRTVRRAADGRPYVPGSALKGALRMTAERLVRQFNVMLDDEGLSPFEKLGYQHRGTDVRDRLCQGPRPETMCQSQDPCIVCRIFGNVFTGTRLHVDDAYPRHDVMRESIKTLAEIHQNEINTSESSKSSDSRLPAKERTFSRSGAVDTLTRLSVDRRRRGAKSGALFTSEYSQPTSGFTTMLSGTLPHTPLEMADGLPAELVLLAATIAATDQIGGEATTGHGLCHLAIDTTEHDTSSTTIVRTGTNDSKGKDSATDADDLNLPDGTFPLQALLDAGTLQALIWSRFM